MMFAINRRLALSVSMLSLLFLGGCGGEDKQVVALRQQLVLSQEPADVSTIEDAKNQIEDHPTVTFVGRVDLTAQALEADSSTAFMVAEILDSDHAHGSGEASDCPFCKHKAAKAPKAAVQFVDEDGKVLPHDPAKLFGIQSGDVVVIHGKGNVIDELNLLNVTADGIFVRKP